MSRGLGDVYKRQEGNLDDAAVQNALRGVKEESAFMRVLGNFEA